jgi:hypothetical protein
MPALEPLCADLLRTGRSVRFTATGASMGPVIRGGDVVTIAPCAGERLRPGVVALYWTPRGLTLHRVLRRRGAILVMRGDALDSPGESVLATSALGRLVSVFRTGRRVSLRVPATLLLHRLARRALGLEPRDADHTANGSLPCPPWER